MRKVKLQVQVTVDGFVGGVNGEMDHLVWNWDHRLKQYVNELHDGVDTILMGRVLYEGMADHWPAIKPDNEQYAFAQRMNNYAKWVFSSTLKGELSWNNSRLAMSDPATVIRELKEQPGKDMMVYGGARFVSGLIREDLVDEYLLFVNPAVLGKGLSIFGSIEGQKKLLLTGATPFECGIVLVEYRPVRA